MKMLRAARLFLSIVWRPVTGDAGDTWLQAWRKYRMGAVTAWKVACIIWLAD
jgi:hypothetical protein